MSGQIKAVSVTADGALGLSEICGVNAVELGAAVATLTITDGDGGPVVASINLAASASDSVSFGGFIAATGTGGFFADEVTGDVRITVYGR